ncbi:MAG TPA: peptide chain release factor N(5)-glutamine methyltransferase [Anaerohalosphaeraceae bacterium]|mgnify:CR=1 FL=1|nr:peptide chain release factor N(5)-glutamine methyltransferase [Anaerohalosphaeraceae bacterium]HOL87872.1 peptide chain release factor N(5)-glutamine methyltransferase [Anaerohalosphaeraceae bacterium]HPP55227.1 peptide chain release factor N(5)-glutamine methyltransferase [Anaerohalosphaeraceae bacterium]
MEIWTIQKLLNWMTAYFTQKQLDSPRLSAELLLCHVLGLQRIELYTLHDRVVQQPQLGQLRELVKRAAEHEPIAYLVGRCEFYSLSLKITPDCLIPRPETELLVEKAVEFLRRRPAPRQALDLCTGCGCIAAALAKNCKDLQITAVDISEAALAVAAENIRRYNLEPSVRLLCGNLYEPLIEELDGPCFDLIVSNPPYVSDAEYEKLAPNVKNYEPKQALWGGPDGLDFYRRILEQAGRFLKPDGAVMLEIGYEQGPAVKQMLEQSGLFASVEIHKDLAQKDRIAIGRR